MTRLAQARFAVVAGLALAFALPALTGARAAAPIEARAAASVAVEVDRSYAIELGEPARTVYVANPQIADVQVGEPRRVVVVGRKPGGTTIYVTAADGAVSAYAITVLRPLRPALEAVKARAPNADLHVSGAPHGMGVSGQVETPREAAAVKAAASQFLDDKESLAFDVGVTGDMQVNLQVRIVEVSRQASRNTGFN